MDKPQEVEFAHLLFGGIAIIVVLALSIVIFVMLYQRKLYVQQTQLHRLELTHQRALLEAALGSQERERERIAQDLHDEVGASLSTVKLFVNQIKYETSPQEMQDLAGQASQILGDIVQDVRQIAYNLSPLVLKNLGLQGAIKTLLNRLEAAGLSVEFTFDLPGQALPLPQQLVLYRIVQETLGNVLKHAQATRIRLECRQLHQRLQLRIEDNGTGFDYPRARARQAGLGMESIKARADLLEAQLTIHSAPGQGTILDLVCPCN